MAESSKAPDAFRTISEVAEELDLPQHVLRFWETRFSQIKPMKRGGGRRYYRPEDVNLLRGIRALLYAEGFTIRGVQRLLKEKGSAYVAGIGQGGAPAGVAVPAPDPSVHRLEPERPQPAPEEEEDVEPEGEIGSNLDARTDPGFAPVEELYVEEDESRAASPPAAAGFAISEGDRRRIELALADLLEAKRLLDQVR